MSTTTTTAEAAEEVAEEVGVAVEAAGVDGAYLVLDIPTAGILMLSAISIPLN